MSTEEREILEFLRGFKAVYVSVVEVSRRLGSRHKFNSDRTWARPILMRLEMEGHLEVNEYGEFRIRHKQGDTDFLEALEKNMPDVDLGETTIIHINDVG